MNNQDKINNTSQDSKIVVLRPSQTAKYMGLSVSTLAKMRVAGTGPVFTKFGSRAVAYLKQDLDAYIMASRRTSTSCNGGL